VLQPPADGGRSRPCSHSITLVGHRRVRQCRDEGVKRRDAGDEAAGGRRVRRRAGDRRVRGADARRRRRAAGDAAPDPRPELRRRVPPGAGPRGAHRPGQLPGPRASRHARRPRALHCARRRRRHLRRPHRQAGHLHLPQLRHDAGEAQVPALQPGARQVHDADIPDFLRFQEQVCRSTHSRL
jgi:hypothetical protein